jgi:hypothetical protein
VVLLLCMEEMNVRPSAGKGSSEPEIVQTVVEGHGEGDVGGAMSQKSEQLTAIAFMSNILKLLQQCMPVNNGLDFEANSDSTSDSNGAAAAGALGILRFPGRAAKKAWRQKAERLQYEWEWRLAVLQHLSPLSPQQPWQWGEALAVLRASPSTLLNMCVQQKQYDLGEETVHRFGLLPEEAATLQLAKWVDDTALTRASTDVGPQQPLLLVPTFSHQDPHCSGQVQLKVSISELG